MPISRYRLNPESQGYKPANPRRQSRTLLLVSCLPRSVWVLCAATNRLHHWISRSPFPGFFGLGHTEPYSPFQITGNTTTPTTVMLPAWFPHERGHVQDVFQPIVRAFRSFIAPRWELPHHPTQPATAHSPKHSAITRSLDFCDIGTLQVSPERASSSVAGSALTALARHLVLLPLHVPIRSFRGCGASGRAPIGLLRSGHASLSKGRGCRSRTSSPPR